MWFGVFYYVVGEYEWSDGECFYGLFLVFEFVKLLLKKGFKVLEVLTKVIFDKNELILK